MTTGDTDDMTNRLLRALPPWFGADDEHPVLTALLTGIAWVLSWLYSAYLFAKAQTRIATSTGGWLELSSYDFFGTTLPRLNGEGDAKYSRRIRLEVLRDRQTRNAIDRAVYDLLGVHPTIFEAWNPVDCGGIGAPAGLALSRVGKYGSLRKPYEVLIGFPYPQNYGIPIRPGLGDPQGGLGSILSFADQTEIVGVGAAVGDVMEALERVRPAGVTYYVQFTEIGDTSDDTIAHFTQVAPISRVFSGAGTATAQSGASSSGTTVNILQGAGTASATATASGGGAAVAAGAGEADAVSTATAGGSYTSSGAPAYIPAGYNQVFAADFKTTGVISVNEAQSDAGRATDKGHWSLGTLDYRDYTKLGIPGYGYDVFVDPFSSATPQDYLFESPLGEFEIIQGTGLKLKSRAPLTTNLKNTMDSEFSGGVNGAPGNGVPLFASAHMATEHKMTIKPPFARVTWAKMDDPNAKSFGAAGWSLVEPPLPSGRQFEIDDVESFDDTNTHHTVHWTDDVNSSYDANGSTYTPPFSFWLATHEYAVVATATDITWYVDGVQAKTLAISSLTNLAADEYLDRMFHIADQSAGFPWDGVAGAATRNLEMVIEKVVYYAPSTNTDMLLPGTPPSEVTVTWRSPYDTNGQTGADDLAVGTILADLSCPDATNFKVWDPGKMIEAVGSVLQVGPNSLSNSARPTVNFHVGGIAADGTPSYGRMHTFNVTAGAGSTNWWVSDSLYDLDFANNRYHGGPTAVTDVLAGANNTMQLDTFGLIPNSDTITAAGVLKTALQSGTACVLVVFDGYQANGTSCLLSPSGTAGSFFLLGVTGAGGLGITASSGGNGLTTDAHSVALGSGDYTGRVNAVIAWDGTIKRMAGNGGAGTESNLDLPAVGATDTITVGRSKFGDDILGNPGASGRIARIVVWDTSAGIPSLATVVSRASLGL